MARRSLDPMLTPLESGLFETVAGLPLHPLVVHFAVVLLPLAALGLIALVAVPAWADRFGWLTLAVLAVGTVAAYVAKQSGESLAGQVGDPVAHASWGDQLPLLAVGLLILAGAWFFLHRRSAADGERARRSPMTISVGVLASLLALTVTAVTVVVGHTGAQAAWADVVVGTQEAPAIEASPAPGGAGISPEPNSPSGSPSASPTGSEPGQSGGQTDTSATGYTLAEVAKHADAASCWTAIDSKVYDLTKWIKIHPGGKKVILALCGSDGSAAFNAEHGGKRRPANELAKYLIGNLG